jgi:hypothetical protein
MMTTAAAARSQKFDTTRFVRTRPGDGLGGAARGRRFVGGGARPRRCFGRRTRERGGGEQADDEKRRRISVGGSVKVGI